MAITETLRPSALSAISGTILDPANAYDGDTGTFCLVSEATEGDTAEVVLDGVPSGSIPTTKRESVLLEVYGDWGTLDSNDKAAIWMRARAADPWTLVTGEKPPAGWAAAYRSFDVTGIVGTQDLADLDIDILFANLGTGSGGDPPDPTA